MTSNKGANYRFATEVALAHHERGFTTVRRPGEPKGVDAADKVRGDLVGLPVTTAVRACRTMDLPAAMREVQAEARAEGRDMYVSIQRRRAMNGQPHDVLDSYVVLDLRCWLDVLARLHPEAVTSWSPLDHGCEES